MKKLEIAIAIILIVSLVLIAGMRYQSVASASIAHLDDWSSVEELEAFLEEDDTDRHVYLKAGSDGVVRFNNQCEDKAFQLRDRAEAIGKRLETEVLDRYEYYKWYKVWLKKNRYHVINKALIGNEWWYIEPSSDRLWLGLYLD